MVCEDFECPALSCDDNEIEGAYLIVIEVIVVLLLQLQCCFLLQYLQQQYKFRCSAIPHCETTHFLELSIPCEATNRSYDSTNSHFGIFTSRSQKSIVNSLSLPAIKDDECCPYCDDSWVEALNPEVTVKKGQKIVLTCAVHADVPKSAITWYKGDHKVKKGISRNRYDGVSAVFF